MIRLPLRILNWVALVGLLLSYTAPFISPKISWIIALLGLTYNAWFVAVVLLLVLGLVFKTKMVLTNLIVLAIGAPLLFRTISIGSPKTGEGDLKVVSFNAYALGNIDNRDTKDEIDTYLEGNQVDVASFAEWRFQRGKTNATKYPYQASFPSVPGHYAGIIMISKWPIVAKGRVPFTEKSYNQACFIDIKRNGKIIRIYGLHLETTRVKSYDYHNLKSLQFDSVYNTKAKNLMSRLKYSMRKRAGQVEDIINHMKACTYPIILMGDFNDTPQSYTYQMLQVGKKDAFIEGFQGFDATYLKPIPFLRIDHILYDETAFSCVRYKSTKGIYSDHKLIFAELKIH